MKKFLFSLILCLGFSIGVKAQLNSAGTYVWNASDEPKTFNYKLQLSFVSSSQGFPQYGTVLAGGGYNTSQDGGVFQMYFPYSESYGGKAPKIRLGKYNNQGWSNWETFYTSVNANLSTVDWVAKNFIAHGNIGIGTENLQEKLNLLGNLNMVGSNRRIFMGGVSGTTFGIAYNSTYPNYGIFYTEGSIDYVSISPNGNATSGVLNIFGNGKIGIGTSSPVYKLDIQGTGSNAGIHLKKTDGVAASWYLHPGRLGKGEFTIGNDAIYTFTILQNGNIGIGTTAPKSKLDLSNNYSDPSIYPNKITLWSGAENNYFGFGISSSDLDYFSQGNHRFYTEFNGTPGSEKMVIKSNGNVGIGTTNPGTYKLAVDGVIGTREVVVTTDVWSDFVFEPTYKLIPLENLEQFIKQNKHLPDVPSADEIEENGLSLGKSDAILLQKIEELTLYLIEQNKEMKEVKERMNKIEAENKKLKERNIQSEKKIKKLEQIR